MSQDQTTTAEAVAANDRGSSARNIQEVLFKAGPFIALLVLVAYLSFASSKFLSFDNFANVGRQTAPLAILAIGQTFVILTGGIDLSVAAVAAFSSAVSAVLLTMPLTLFGIDFGFVPVPLCILIGLLTGLVAGLLNGWIISTFKIPDFIATLGTMQVFRGVALLTTSGQSVPGPDATREMPDSLVWAGSGHVLGIPVSVFLAAACAGIAWYILKYTTLGRAIFAVGGNREAARVCGISIGRTKLYVYAISGLLSAIAGLILVGRLSSANALLGEGLELHAIASVVIGGTNLFGGEGGILGSVVGAVLIGVLGNGLNLLGVSPFYQRIAQGLVVVTVVVFDQWRRRSASKV
jgi:ribose transport system permease protein